MAAMAPALLLLLVVVVSHLPTPAPASFNPLGDMFGQANHTTTTNTTAAHAPTATAPASAATGPAPSAAVSSGHNNNGNKTHEAAAAAHAPTATPASAAAAPALSAAASASAAAPAPSAAVSSGNKTHEAAAAAPAAAAGGSPKEKEKEKEKEEREKKELEEIAKAKKEAAANPNLVSLSADDTGAYKGMTHEFLEGHNVLRKRYGVPPMKWNTKLARYARRWSNAMRKDCELKHSTGSNYGENVFVSRRNTWNATAKDAIWSWLNEEKLYDRATTNCTAGHHYRDCGHFKNMVSEKNTKVGCARGECYKGGVFMSCNYYVYNHDA